MRITEILRPMFSMDLRTIALVRIFLAVILIVDLLFKLPWLGAFYSDAGLLPRAELIGYGGAKSYLWSLHFISGEWYWQAFLWFIALLAACSLALGYRARLSCFLSWILFVSAFNRNNGIVSGADDLLCLLLFWAMFLPLGVRLAVDQLSSPDHYHSVPNEYFSSATAIFLLQAASLYFFAALLKDSPAWGVEGTAVYLALHLDHYATQWAEYIRGFPLLLQGLTKFVWWLELCMPVFMFLPIGQWTVRLLVMLLLIGMHLGFHIFLQIGLFAFISIASVLAFTPGVVWDWLNRRLATKRRCDVIIWYDTDCGFCRQMCFLMKTLLILPWVQVRPAIENDQVNTVLQREYSWVVQSSAGKQFLRWGAFVHLVSISPLWFWISPLLRIPRLALAGDKAYCRVGGARELLGQRLNAVLPPYRPIFMPSWLTTATLVLLAMASIGYYNVRGLVPEQLPMPLWLKTPLSVLHLKQKWNMFAPQPMTGDGWYIVEGMLEDGRSLNLLDGSFGWVDRAKPDLVSDMYPMWRWRKFMVRMYGRRYLLRHYANYHCRNWNRGLPDLYPEYLKQVTITYMREATLLNYQSSIPEEQVLRTHQCS
ncbi:MAG: HTTM domain-containing protein [Pseudomonadales bacterium]